MAFTEQQTGTNYHPASTCAIGRVVDSDLRVFGTKGLRVADASVMPSIVRGNTNAAVIAIAEKAATFCSGRKPPRRRDHFLGFSTPALRRDDNNRCSQRKPSSTRDRRFAQCCEMLTKGLDGSRCEVTLATIEDTAFLTAAFRRAEAEDIRKNWWRPCCKNRGAAARWWNWKDRSG